METRVLVPVDDSGYADDACELAGELFPEATVLLLHVINPSDAGYSSEGSIPGVSEGWYDQQEARAETLFAELEPYPEGWDVEHHIELGQPAQTIVDCAEREGVNHIVMGSRGRQGVSRLLLGSVAETVIRRSPVPVTVAR